MKRVGAAEATTPGGLTHFVPMVSALSSEALVIADDVGVRLAKVLQVPYREYDVIKQKKRLR